MAKTSFCYRFGDFLVYKSSAYLLVSVSSYPSKHWIKAAENENPCLTWLITYAMSNSVTDKEMCIFLCLFVFTILTGVELLKNTLEIDFNHYKQWKIRLKSPVTNYWFRRSTLVAVSSAYYKLLNRGERQSSTQLQVWHQFY